MREPFSGTMLRDANTEVEHREVLLSQNVSMSNKFIYWIGSCKFCLLRGVNGFANRRQLKESTKVSGGFNAHDEAL